MTAEITQWLLDAQRGDSHAMDRLFAAAYDELRRLAQRQIRRLKPGNTLQTTAVVHEAYLKLFDSTRLDLRGRAHFYALAAQAMRQILVNHFRSQGAAKRGGGLVRVTLDDGAVPLEARGDLLLALDEALERLAQLSERLFRVVECKFFGGMTEDQIALALNVSDRTVRNDWRKARAWLTRELSQLG